MDAEQVLSEFPGRADDSRVWFGHSLLLCFGWAEFLGRPVPTYALAAATSIFPEVHFLHFYLHQLFMVLYWTVRVKCGIKLNVERLHIA